MEQVQHSLDRWQDLPDIELYMDQLVTYIERQLEFLVVNDDKLITPSMVNNYVKLNLIPKPVKKRYRKEHLAYLTAITVLKQVMPIPTVKNGVDQLIEIHGQKDAYNLFCDVFENVYANLSHQIAQNTEKLILDGITKDTLSLYLACIALVTKIKAIEQINHIGG